MSVSKVQKFVMIAFEWNVGIGIHLESIDIKRQADITLLFYIIRFKKKQLKPETWMQLFQLISSEPRREKTNILVFKLVRHKPSCTATEDVDYGLKKVLLPTPREFCRRSLS